MDGTECWHPVPSIKTSMENSLAHCFRIFFLLCWIWSQHHVQFHCFRCNSDTLQPLQQRITGAGMDSSCFPYSSMPVTGAGISAAVHPLPATPVATSYYFPMVIGYCIAIGIFGCEIVYERQHKIKWQFSLMSTGSAVYWMSTLMADFLHLLPPLVLCSDLMVAAYSVIFIFLPIAKSRNLPEYVPHFLLTGS